MIQRKKPLIIEETTNILSMKPKSVVVVHDETPESDHCCAGVSSYAVMIEFVGRRQVRGVPIRCLNQ